MTLTHNPIPELTDTIDFLLDAAINADNSLRDTIGYRYLAGNYRIRAERPHEEDNRKIVLNTLEQYPAATLYTDIQDTIDARTKRVITRDLFLKGTEWAYRYGAKGRPLDDMEPPVFEGANDPHPVVEDINDRINTTPLTVNDAAFAQHLTHNIYYHSNREDITNDIYDTPAYTHTQTVLNLIGGFIDQKTIESIDWNMLGATFDQYAQMTQEDIKQNIGERSVLRELREFDGDSISAFLNNR